MIDIQNVYSLAFFDKHLKGLATPLLDGPSPTILKWCSCRAILRVDGGRERGENQASIDRDDCPIPAEA